MLKGTIPIQEQTENHPPTQFQNSNTFSSEIPNFLVSTRFVEQAAK